MKSINEATMESAHRMVNGTPRENDETPMHYRTQQEHEQIWGFHAHLPIGK